MRDLEGELRKDQRQTCVALGQKPFPVAPTVCLSRVGTSSGDTPPTGQSSGLPSPKGDPAALPGRAASLEPPPHACWPRTCNSLGSSLAPDRRLSRTAGRPWEKQLYGSWAGSFSPGTPGSATIPAWSPPFTEPDIGMFAPDEHYWPHPSEPPRPCPGRWGLNLVCPRLWPSGLEPRTGAKSEYVSAWGTALVLPCECTHAAHGLQGPLQSLS